MCLIEVYVDSLKLHVAVSFVDPYRIDAMFFSDHFPKLKDKQFIWK